MPSSLHSLIRVRIGTTSSEYPCTSASLCMWFLASALKQGSPTRFMSPGSLTGQVLCIRCCLCGSSLCSFCSFCSGSLCRFWSSSLSLDCWSSCPASASASAFAVASSVGSCPGSMLLEPAPFWVRSAADSGAFSPEAVCLRLGDAWLEWASGFPVLSCWYTALLEHSSAPGCMLVTGLACRASRGAVWLCWASELCAGAIAAACAPSCWDWIRSAGTLFLATLSF
mmetsp:Transcript_41446/g.96813  ORF Transcript_41446/g.96813 Transcript_41446/m.96813 type:complete len:226 (+) Transcript_41446:103-780(+)